MNYYKLFIFLSLATLIVLISARYLFCADKPHSEINSISSAEMYMDKREYMRSEPIFEKYIKSSDLDLRRQALYGLGRVYYYRRNFKLAKRNFKAALALPQNLSFGRPVSRIDVIVGLHLFLSYTYDNLGEYDKEILALKNAVDMGLIESSSKGFLACSIYSSIGAAYLNLDDIESAKKYFILSSELRIKNKEVASDIQQLTFIGLGRCYFLSGDYSYAALYFKKAVKDNADRNGYDLKAWMGLCDSYLYSGNYTKAYSECANKLSELALGLKIGKIPGGMKAKAIYDLGMINFKNNKPKEAEGYFKIMLAEISGFPAPTAQQVNISNFYSALAHYGLSLIYFADKNYEQARTETARAIELLDAGTTNALMIKNDARYLEIAVRYHLCKILEAQEQKNSAEAEFKKLTDRINGFDPRTKEILDKKRIEHYIEGKSLQEIIRNN